MNKLKILGLLLAVLLFNQCTQVKQLAAFSKCEFRMADIHSVNLNGVNLEGKKTYADLSLMEIAKITKGYTSGKLPLNMVADVEVKNPNAETAAITRTEWKAFLDDNEIASNLIEERVEVAPNGGTSIMKIQVSSNIRETVSSEGKKDLINLLANLYGAGNEPSNLQLQLKPSIKVGSGSINYPGYIKVTKTFGSE